jgi:tRNA-binding EMAP/Myf-like protein
MQFPESWLREFCDPPIGTAELAEKLTMAGLEVENLRAVAPPFHGVVVAKVLSVAPHPNADRLRVCEVDVGAAETLSIVCGAPNVRAGMKAPCALVGAELPPAKEGASEPFRIEAGKIAASRSRGMLCSARELKISDDHEGLLALDDSATIGADVREALRLDDTIFTLKLTPNLGHALSVYGIAREVAAITGAPLKSPAFAKAPVGSDRKLPVTIEAPDLCGRFSGRVVTGVDAKAKTPPWMADRLARCGQRTVSPLVDISNYVMFEFGRPSHIFDLDKIEGGLTVRWGKKGESLELLNGNTVELDETVGVIADAKHVESLGRHHGRRGRPRCRTPRATSTSRPRSGGPKRSPAGRAATTSRPMPAIASSAASTRDDGRAHRATDVADPRDLRRRGDALRPDRRSGHLAARARTGDLARRARRQGDRHAGDPVGLRKRDGPPRLRVDQPARARSTSCRRAGASTSVSRRT